MTVTNPSGQSNPDEGFDEDLPEVARRVRETAKALDDNAGPIHRWFWKGLLAFNLFLWSVALCAIAFRALA